MNQELKSKRMKYLLSIVSTIYEGIEKYIDMYKEEPEAILIIVTDYEKECQIALGSDGEKVIDEWNKQMTDKGLFNLLATKVDRPDIRILIEFPEGFTRTTLKSLTIHSACKQQKITVQFHDNFSGQNHFYDYKG